MDRLSESAERREQVERRRRRLILQLIRENHEDQGPRYTDGELWAMLLKIRQTVGSSQVVTLLQDLQTLGYIDFTSRIDGQGNTRLSEIMLTAEGLRFYTRRKSNDDVSFD
jgi:hypothetical protein